MTHQHPHAAALLLEAANTLNKPEFAKAGQVYAATAQLWQTYIDVLRSLNRPLAAYDVLQLLDLLAKAKGVVHPEHITDMREVFIEQAVCTAGSAQLAGITYPEPTKQEEPKADMPEAAKPYIRPAGVRPTVPARDDDTGKAIDAIVRANGDKH